MKAQPKDSQSRQIGRVLSKAESTSDGLAQIISIHQNGYLNEAEIQYREFLVKQPKHADALQLLGTVFAQKGLNELSMDCFKQSLAINPNQAVVHNNLGNVYINQKMFDLALSSFEVAIKLQRHYPQAWHNKGNVYFQLGDYAKSIESYKVAIQLNPKDSQNYNHLGNAQQALCLYEEALKSYKISIELNPLNAEVYNNQGALYQNICEYENALISFDRAIELQGNNPQAHFNRGRVLKELSRVKESIDSFCHAIEIKPDFFEAYNNLANVLKDEQEWEQAFTLYTKVIELKPDFAQAYYNRGTILQEFNELEQATLNYEMALRLAPEYIDAHLNLGLVSLMSHDFSKGWLHYEWRFKSMQFKTDNLYSDRPQWSPISHQSTQKRLLIWSEQGVGDELMFCSLLSQFVSQLSNTSVLVQIDARLLPLMRRSLAGIEFCSKTDPISDAGFDEQMPMGRLASFMRASLDSFLKQTGYYLLVDELKTRVLKQHLMSQISRDDEAEHPNSKFRWIGISWRSKAVKTGEQRSLALQDLVLALNAPDVKFISLQYGDVSQEIAECKLNTDIHIEQVACVDNFHDLDGLASLIQACDEVVCVDNATVHLSAVIGKKTKVLLPFHPDWRWGLSSSKSIWYPGLELLRQSVPGDWSSVLLALRSSS